MNKVDKVIIAVLVIEILIYPFLGLLAVTNGFGSASDGFFWATLIRIGLFVGYIIFRRKPILKTLYPET
jgi:Kef-type K+ transport system membrane component KefB